MRFTVVYSVLLRLMLTVDITKILKPINRAGKTFTSQQSMILQYAMTSKVKIVRQFIMTCALQLLPVLMKIENELILLVLVYRPPRPIGTFVYELIQEISTLPLAEYREYRTLIVGDFNLDQMLEENVRMFEQLLTHFNCQQRSHYSTHIRGEILDLVFDDRRSESVQWMPSPYSDHFVILIDV